MFVKQLYADDWAAYKKLRLEALSLHPGNFGASYDDEAAQQDLEWQETMRGAGHQAFGLFDGATMVGIGAVFQKREQQRTAIIAAAYIQEAYRGRGHSALLYRPESIGRGTAASSIKSSSATATETKLPAAPIRPSDLNI